MIQPTTHQICAGGRARTERNRRFVGRGTPRRLLAARKRERGNDEHLLRGLLRWPTTQPLAHAQLGASTAASSDDFDWGDAAVGAGGAVVILLVGAGGVRAAAVRRARDTGGAEVTAAS